MHIPKKNSYFTTLSTALLVCISTINLYASKINPNKELFEPDPAIFSSSPAIDYSGIETHIHYEFKNKNLLRDALHPMLPEGLGSNSITFDQLEFSGDSVLGTIIRKRLIHLFPTQNRGNLVRIYELLTCNKNLTDQFLFQLDLEQFLPLPTQGYEICNVVEALIGAIEEDDPINGMNNATRFVLRLMNEELFNNKLQVYATQRNVVFNHQMLPEQERILATVCTPQRVQNESSKAILNELLLKLFDDRPEYVTTISKGENGDIFYQTTVIGSQIGSKNIGRGQTVIEAETNAAKVAVNKLAQTDLYPLDPLQPNARKYRSQLNELSNFLQIKLIYSRDYNPFEINHDGLVIGRGTGKNKDEAKEVASKEACEYLAQNEMDRIKIRQEKRLEQRNVHFLKRIQTGELSKIKTELTNCTQKKLSKNQDTRQLLSTWSQNHITRQQVPIPPVEAQRLDETQGINRPEHLETTVQSKPTNLSVPAKKSSRSKKTKSSMSEKPPSNKTKGARAKGPGK